MIIDGRTIGSGTTIDTRVCIVGAGPAGLSVARELLAHGIGFCVVESGGFTRDDAIDDLGLCALDDGPDQYPDPRWARSRRVGGTSDQWDVPFENEMQAHVRPFDPIDFRRRDGIAHTGWPIDETTLAPYWARAHAGFGVEDFDYTPSAWQTVDRPLLPFASGRIESRMLTTGRQSGWLRLIPEALRRHATARLITHATVVELLADPAGQAVRTLRCASPGAGQFTVRASWIVLAQGGFEVPRLLLASTGARPQGLGNAHDRVGRFLMDRQLVRTGILTPPQRAGLNRFGFYDSRIQDGRFVLGKFKLADATLQSEGILSAAIGMAPMAGFSPMSVLHHPYGRETTWRSAGFASLRAIQRAARRGSLPSGWPRHVLRAIGGLDDVLYLKVLRRPGFQTEFNRDCGGWSALPDLARRFATMELNQVTEQAPDPDNRITLTRERDALGMPVPLVRLRLGAIDLRTASRTQEIVAEEMKAAGLGTVKFQRRDGEPLYFTMSTHHPAGTARMADDPREGVVDAQCRLHDAPNVYVASSAVFPTGGCFPPTLTIAALGIRIADHLRAQLARADATAAAPAATLTAQP